MFPRPKQGVCLERSDMSTKTAQRLAKTSQHFVMAAGSEGVPCGSYSAPQSTLFGPTSMYEASSRTTRITHEKTRPKRTAGDMFKRRSTFGVGTLESLFRLSSLYLSAATHTQVRRTQHEHCRRSHLTATSTPPHPFFRCEKY